MQIELRGVSKRFGDFAALTGVDLRVSSGELLALLGPSGSGKTTLLRVIAGLETPDSGVVMLDGRDATMQRVRDRKVGFVFQHYALFRHLTVFENIAFGLRVRPRARRPKEAAIKETVQRLLDLVQLEPQASRYPSQLSGGQRQRVALARALAVEPSVLLLDEPFGSLDAKVRKDLRRWLRRLHDTLNVTSVFVTHDQEEAMELAGRVVIMNRGRIEQVGSPDEVYSRPETPFVYDFLGDINLFHGRIEDGHIRFGPLAVKMPGLASAPTRDAALYLRPHLLDVRIEPGDHPEFPAEVVHINPAGPLVKLELRCSWGELVRVDMPQDRYRALGLRCGARVHVGFLATDLFIAPARVESSVA